MFEWLKLWRRPDRDVRDEITYHLEMLAQDQVDRGVTVEEAQFEARRKLGNPTRAAENTRAVWIVPLIETFFQDLRYAMRTLRKSPAFALTAVLSLALGIGANTAIFSLIDALLLRMLPVPNPQQLLKLVTISTHNGEQFEAFPYPAIKTLEQRTDLFSGLCGFSGGTKFNAGRPGAIQSTPGAWVTGSYYETLGVHAVLGRTLKPEDDEPAAEPVAVISYAYWENRFQRDPNVIGKQILVDGTPVSIVGVSARGFEGANVGVAIALTLPIAALPRLFPEQAGGLRPSSWWLRAFARPKPGLSSKQIAARLAVIWPHITKELVIPIRSAAVRQAILASSIDIVPGGTGWTYLRHTFKRPLFVLMALVALVLLVACVNVANLLLTRAVARSREIAVRVAIGAGRGRLIRQLLTESILLACFGAGLGILLAYAADRVLIATFSSGQEIPFMLDVRPDLRVLGFTIAVALAGGILFGLAPAFRATGLGREATLSHTRAVGQRRTWFAPALVISQIALSLLLLVGAGLFVRTLENLQNSYMGFRQQGILLATLDPRHAGYSDSRLITLYQELLQRIGELPGVQSTSLSWNTPLSGLMSSDPILIDGRHAPSNAHRNAAFNNISPGYFATMQTPLLLGRDFSLRDAANSPPVAIVNEAFVRMFLNGANPLGRHVSIQDSTDWQDMQIVGVVKNAIYSDLRQAPPAAVYVPYFQNVKKARDATIEVRAEGSMTAISDTVYREIHGRLPDTALSVRPFTKQIAESLVQERLIATFASFFGLLALVLAAVGLYGLVAYTVTRRTSEIGVRMALGASRNNVLSLVLRGALALALAGIVAGLPLALASSRFVSNMLFGVRPTDPLTAGSAAALLVVVALIAAYVPARRASRVDPLAALRYD